MGKWFTVLYLYQSVCQSSTLLQRSEGKEQQYEKKDEEKVKDTGTPGRINHHKTKEEIQDKDRHRITETSVDVCEGKKRQR